MIYGVEEYGISEFGIPASESEIAPAAKSRRAFLADPANIPRRIFLVETKPFDTELFAPQVEGFAHGPESDPLILNNTQWTRRLARSFTTSIGVSETDKGFEEEFQPTFGTVEIAISDGERDSLVNHFWETRAVRVLVGDETFQFSDFFAVATATVRNVIWDLDTLRVEFEDLNVKVDRDISEDLFLGTGNAEGGDDLEGKPRPVCFGLCRNIEPVLVDRDKNLYQVHDGLIKSVDTVYDQGVPLTKSTLGPFSDGNIGVITHLLSATVPAGEYATSLEAGLIRLGSEPEGTITADVQGDADSDLGGYVENVFDVVERILKQRAELTASDIDTASFDLAKTRKPFRVGVYVGSSKTNITAVLGELLRSVLGAFGFTPDGKFTAVTFFFGEPVVTFDENDIIAIEREATNVAAKEERLGFRKNWHVQAKDDLKSGVTSAQEEFVKEEFRFVSETFNSPAIVSPPSRIIEVETLIDKEADATTQLEDEFAIFKKQGDRYNVRVRGVQFRLKLGDTVKLSVDRFGLDDRPTDFIVLGVDEDSVTGLTDLRLYGIRNIPWEVLIDERWEKTDDDLAIVVNELWERSFSKGQSSMTTQLFCTQFEFAADPTTLGTLLFSTSFGFESDPTTLGTLIFSTSFGFETDPTALNTLLFDTSFGFPADPGQLGSSILAEDWEF